MSNRIGFIDVDGHGYPNLAIMKLSAWHKSHGDTTGFANPLESYDKVYMSKVFTFTPDYPYTWDCETEKGGTGYLDYTKVLPEEVEHTCPDYLLYGIDDVAYGFTTRGCIRHCPFCLVHDKEGMIREHADLDEFLGGRKNVVLMDNNIVAHDHGIRQLEKCRERKIAVDCNQGIDARIVYKSEYLIDLLSSIKVYGRSGIRFACDDKSEIIPCQKAVDKILERNPKAIFSIYCILTDDYNDSLKRVMLWRKYGHIVCVYAPPYRNFSNPNQVIPQWQKDMARWANNRILYYSTEWENYMKTKKEEQEETLF